MKPEVEVTRIILACYAAAARTTTYGALYDELREDYYPDWPERTPGHDWMRYLPLFEVAELNRQLGEPMLVSLVRRQDTGNVGDGYAGAVFARYDFTPQCPQLFSQVETGKCFRHFGPVE
jgi:hypothetical protein